MAQTQLSFALATFVVGTPAEAIPADVQTCVKHLILDAVGNAYASTRYEFANRALTALQGLDEGQATVIGMPARLTVRDAALMNGILIHGLDFDDTYLPGCRQPASPADSQCGLQRRQAPRKNGFACSVEGGVHCSRVGPIH